MTVSRYFTPARRSANEATPPPISLTVTRIARFHEIDPLNVVWHGHYASYFEDARVAFGDKFGIGYTTMYACGVVTPVKQMHIEYDAPLRFGEECAVTATLFWNAAARLDFEYAIRNAAGTVTTKGYTVQLFTTLAGEMLFAKPDFYEDFCSRWRQNLLEEGSCHA